MLFSRNFLWKKEVQLYYSREFLFTNIFNNNCYKAEFCKIAMQLYVDHDPLNPKKWPENTIVMNDF